VVARLNICPLNCRPTGLPTLDFIVHRGDKSINRHQVLKLETVIGQVAQSDDLARIDAGSD
jgi:hypothetical protein